MLQISERQLVQVCTVLGTKLKRIAVDIDQLDTRSLSPLLSKPLFVEADCYGQALVALTIGIYITHLEGTESGLLSLHPSYQLSWIAFLRAFLWFFVVVVEAPREAGRVIGDINRIVLYSVSVNSTIEIWALLYLPRRFSARVTV
jgi:hypothetical protein